MPSWSGSQRLAERKAELIHFYANAESLTGTVRLLSFQKKERREGGLHLYEFAK